MFRSLSKLRVTDAIQRPRDKCNGYRRSASAPRFPQSLCTQPRCNTLLLICVGVRVAIESAPKAIMQHIKLQECIHVFASFGDTWFSISSSIHCLVKLTSSKCCNEGNISWRHTTRKISIHHVVSSRYAHYVCNPTISSIIVCFFHFLMVAHVVTTIYCILLGGNQRVRDKTVFTGTIQAGTQQRVRVDGETKHISI